MHPRPWRVPAISAGAAFLLLGCGPVRGTGSLGSARRRTRTACCQVALRFCGSAVRGFRGVEARSRKRARVLSPRVGFRAEARHPDRAGVFQQGQSAWLRCMLRTRHLLLGLGARDGHRKGVRQERWRVLAVRARETPLGELRGMRAAPEDLPIDAACLRPWATAARWQASARTICLGRSPWGVGHRTCIARMHASAFVSQSQGWSCLQLGAMLARVGDRGQLEPCGARARRARGRLARPRAASGVRASVAFDHRGSA